MSSAYVYTLNLHFSFLAKIYYKSSNILGNWLDGLEKCGTLLERNYAGLLNGQWETKNSHTYLSGRWIPYNFSVIGWEDEERNGVSFIQSFYSSTDKHGLSTPRVFAHMKSLPHLYQEKLKNSKARTGLPLMMLEEN